MKVAHLVFLSLYALQTSGLNASPESPQDLEKRSFHLGSFFKGFKSHTSGESTGSTKPSSAKSGSSESSSSNSGSESSSSNSGSESSGSKSDDESNSSPSKSITTLEPTKSATTGATKSATTGATKSATTDATKSATTDATKAATTDATKSVSTDVTKVSSTDTATGIASADASENKDEAEKKKNFLSKSGDIIKDVAIEAVGGIIVDVAVNEIMNGESNSSTDSDSSTDEDLQTVQFVITTSGIIETTTIVAPSSDFSTGANEVLYLKTDAISDAIDAASSNIYASTSTATSLL